MTALLEQLDISSANLKKSLGSTINSHLMDTGQIAYNELFYEFESGHGGINFAMLRDDELRTLIETPVANFKLSDRINDGLVPDLQNNIKNELTRLFLIGASMPKVSSRLAELGYSSYRRAMTITRTEAGRVQAIARQKAQMEAEKIGIKFEKQWVATLDKRTRHNHQELDGVRVKPKGYFKINGHKTKQPHMFGIASEDINCRCRTISRLKGDDTAILRRDNETKRVVEYKNYREWEANSILSEQKKMFTRFKSAIENGIIKAEMNEQKQLAHIIGSKEHSKRISNNKKKGMKYDPSYLTISISEADDLIKMYSGKGKFPYNKDIGFVPKKEIITHDKVIGVYIDPRTGFMSETNKFRIHYGKTGSHIVPTFGVEK